MELETLEFQLLLEGIYRHSCRNVMIYFDRPLQNRVQQLFHQSLERFGILALGHKESIRSTAVEHDYEELDAAEKLYRRIR